MVSKGGFFMQQERHYEFRERMRQVHRPGRREAGVTPVAGEVMLDESWVIAAPAGAPETVLRVARDLQEYFFDSMDLSLLLVEAGSGDGRRELRLELRPAGTGESIRGSFRVDVASDGIVLEGMELQGLWNGAVYLEDQMNLREAPILALGKATRTPLMKLRRVHSGSGIDDYPDWQLRAIVHAGFNTIELFVRDLDKTALGYNDINDIIQRAANYGLDTFFYSYMPSYKHPDEPDAEEFFDSIYGELFRRYPGACGIGLVGESLEFPSRDPNTTGKRWRESMKDGIPDTRPSPGWWPCEDYPAYIDCIKRVIRRVKPDAEIIFSTYNWGYSPLEQRRRFLEALPKDVTLQVTYEIFREKRIGKLSCPTMDYTISDVEPGYYFSSEAAAAHELGIRLSATTNTAGATWDFGTVPYVPVPHRWIKRLNVLEKARQDWGLERLYETHHFGWWPSVIIDLRKASFWQPRAENLEALLPELARRDYGTEAAADIIKVWQRWSDAMEFYVASNEDQYGPWRVGPAYPFIFQPNITRTMGQKEIAFPSAPYAHFGGRIVKTLYQPFENANQSPGPLRYPQDLERLARMREIWEDGLRLLEATLDKIPARKRDRGNELFLLGSFIRRSIDTVINIKRWWLLNIKLQASSDAKVMLDILTQLEELAAEEIANARATIPIVEQDSRLGWEPSMEYVCDKWHLEWKIRQVESALREIASYRHMLQL